jgi:hypothetical protein
MSTAVQLINDWIRQNALPIALPWQGPKASLSFDSVRVHLHVLGSGAILLEARLCDLPEAPTARDQLLMRLGRTSLGRMRDNPAVLSVDADGSAAWLQRRVQPAIPPHELDEAVEALVNEIELWRSLL